MLFRRAIPARSILRRVECQRAWCGDRIRAVGYLQSGSSSRQLTTAIFSRSLRQRIAHNSKVTHPSILRRQLSSATGSAVTAGYRLGNSFLGATLLLVSAYGYFYITDTRASIHQYVIVPVIRALFPDAEDAHRAGVNGLKVLYQIGLNPRERGNLDSDGVLTVDVFGHPLLNPLGISAGLDKDGEIVGPLFDLGAAVVEIGGVTPLPQEGNPKPRVWRVPSQEAMINRYGLNSKGAAAVARTLRKRLVHFAEAQGYGIGQDAVDFVLNGHAGVPPGSLTPGKLLAVQIAKNKATPESDTAAVVSDYVSCVQQLGVYADILVINVSSPNTPGLRTLQQSEPLQKILTGVVQAAETIPRRTRPSIMVKVSPDENADEDIDGICDAVWASGVDGVIVANTTRGRPIHSPHLLTASDASIMQEQGGYSGPALFEATLSLIQRYRKALDLPLHEAMEVEGSGHVPRQLIPKTIFASGGIASGEDVLKVCNAGASIAMAYTAISYRGSGFFYQCKRQMRQQIESAVKTKNPIQTGRV